MYSSRILKHKIRCVKFWEKLFNRWFGVFSLALVKPTQSKKLALKCFVVHTLQFEIFSFQSFQHKYLAKYWAFLNHLLIGLKNSNMWNAKHLMQGSWIELALGPLEDLKIWRRANSHWRVFWSRIICLYFSQNLDLKLPFVLGDLECAESALYLLDGLKELGPGDPSLDPHFLLS